MTPLTARRGGPLQGRARVPGDKSISHRALILGALTVGETTIAGLLEGEDVLHTAAAMRALGARLERGGDGIWRIHGVGVGGFAQPAGSLDFGNSGTGCRLAIGAVAGSPVTATFDGDASLAQAADAARARSAGEDGRARRRSGRRRPPAADACRRARSDPDRLRISGAVGAVEVGGAAGRAFRAGRDHGDRGGGDARPHRAHAQAFRRQGDEQALWRARPPHHACRPARARAGERRGAGRSVLGGVSAGRRAARARLRADRSKR